jgi:AcrR family transcriptional regulator
VARYRVGLETRERILEATRVILAEHGIDGITLKRITAQADVGVGSFYNLFDSKEAAVFEVIRQALQAVDPHPGSADGDRLEELVEAFVSFMTGSSTIARIYLQLAGLGLTDAAIAARVLRSHRRRVARFAAACRRDDPTLSEEEARERAETIMAALTGLGLTALIDPTFDMRAHAARLLLPTHSAGPSGVATASAPTGGVA